MSPKTITIINGSLGGEAGNTARVLAPLRAHLQRSARVEELTLAAAPRRQDYEALLGASDGFVFATGTYWDSWGSPLQRFLEEATHLEGTAAWVGKPAAVVVTMHSVGGKGVLSRLQGVLSTLGCLLPPMSGLVYSLASQLALRHAPADEPWLPELWQLDELEVIGHNLLQAVSGGSAWRLWQMDRDDPRRLWVEP